MTPAEELRAAAQRIREVAGKATPGPWTATDNRSVEGATRRVVASVAARELWPIQEDAEHISMWDPFVAALVVPILELEAKQWDAIEWQNSREGEGRTRVMPHDLDVAVLHLARAILGRPL